jgi:hypothetical protein
MAKILNHIERETSCAWEVSKVSFTKLCNGVLSTVPLKNIYSLQLEFLLPLIDVQFMRKLWGGFNTYDHGGYTSRGLGCKGHIGNSYEPN